MPSPLTPEQIATIKATIPALEQHGVAITTLMYSTMIEENPELRNLFSLPAQASGAQPRALAKTVLAYAQHIDNIPVLLSTVDRISHKHASVQLKPGHYDIVGRYLIQAIGNVLGDAATPEIVAAWTAAYSLLASVFIDKEKAQYSKAEAAGWLGWRGFRVVRRAPANESGSILELDLSPVDGGKVPAYTTGQYVSLRLDVPSLKAKQARQYNLRIADPAKAMLRISVKRDKGDSGIPGIVSNMVHELQEGAEVELSQPQGEFVLAAGRKADAPIALISAGIGASPVLSLLEAAVSGQQNPVSWVHTSHSLAELPFFDEVRALQTAHPTRIKTYFSLTESGAAKPTPETADIFITGKRLSLKGLSDDDRKTFLFSGNADADYYLSGPVGFVAEAKSDLEAQGVSSDRIHYELFIVGGL